MEIENNKIRKQFEDYLKNYVSESSRHFSDSDKLDMAMFKELLDQDNSSKDLCSKLERQLGRLKGKRHLDIGCGSGGRTIALAHTGARSVGIDPVRDAVKASLLRALLYSELNIDFLIGKGEDLSFKDESFDLVTSFYSLEHTRDMEKVISEARRVLKKGGSFYCELPNSLFPQESHYKIFWFPLAPRWFNRLYLRIRDKDTRGLDEINYITRRGMIKRLKDIGFTNIRDLNIDYVKKRISNPELIVNPTKRIIARLFVKLKIHKVFDFFIIRLGLYPAIHLIAQKNDKDL